MIVSTLFSQLQASTKRQNRISARRRRLKYFHLRVSLWGRIWSVTADNDRCENSPLAASRRNQCYRCPSVLAALRRRPKGVKTTRISNERSRVGFVCLSRAEKFAYEFSTCYVFICFRESWQRLSFMPATNLRWPAL